jgi:5-methylcytosine-specific restriction endonuclease McrA
MAQTHEGAMKAAAARAGLPVNEYLDQLNRGLLHCWRCPDWHDADAFGKDSSRWNGRASSCRQSRNAARDRKNPERPGKPERNARRAQGQAWCRGCEDWLPAADVRSGVCRTHAAEQYRTHYAANPGPIRMRVHARKRQLDPIPSWWVEQQMAKFGGLCAYGCGREASTMDHVWPVSRRGKSEPSNLVPACQSCNSSKSDRDPTPWVARFAVAFPDQFEALVGLSFEHPSSLDMLEVS